MVKEVRGVHLDLFILQNLLYEYLILSGVAVLIDEKLRFRYLICGLVLSLFLSMLTFAYFPNLLIFIPLLTLKIVFANSHQKKYLKSVVYFYCLSMFLSGLVHTLAYFVDFARGLLPYLLIAGALAVVGTLIYGLKMKWLSEQEMVDQFTHEVRFFCGRAEVKGIGFVDTGNHLVDHKTTNPVMVVPKEKLGVSSIEDFLRGQRLSFWETKYSVINNEDQSLLIFKPTLLLINDTIVHNVVIGVIENSFFEYDFLLQPSIVKYI